MFSRREQSSERSSMAADQTDNAVLLLRCKTTIDELTLEVEKTEEEKGQIQRKFERLLNEFHSKEREFEDGKAFTQGIIGKKNKQITLDQMMSE